MPIDMQFATILADVAPMIPIPPRSGMGWAIVLGILVAIGIGIFVFLKRRGKTAN